MPPRPTPSLVILDDCFPNLLTAFRVAEFNAYLEHFGTNVEVHTTGDRLATSSGEKSFDASFRQYSAAFPQYAQQVKRLHPGDPLNAKLVYLVFLMNAHAFLPAIEAANADLIFTLYPGGAFFLDIPSSDERLKRVCGYRNLKKIIVTQKVTRDYLLRKGFCDESMIEYIWGVVVPPAILQQHDSSERSRFGINKQTLDICFISHKYASLGKDKGYDVFIDTAKLLAQWNPNVRFHVVGNYEASDYPMREIGDKLTFHGLLTTADMHRVLRGMDLILSPNAPFILDRGGFDGFLTASCVEAGLNGAAVFCTDILKENVYYKDGEEIVMINRNPADIFEQVRTWAENPEKLARLGANCQAAFRRMYSPENQITPRINVLRRTLGE